VTGTFKANNPYNNFLLFIYGLVLKLPSFIHPEVPKPEKMGWVFIQTFHQLASSGRQKFHTTLQHHSFPAHLSAGNSHQ
jgi:hypothetical protein